MIRLTVNGTVRNLDVDPQMPLLWLVRDELGLTGTKFGCGVAACGACTVHVGGQPVRACSIPVSAVEGDVVTIEAIATPEARAVQQAWQKMDVPQCGYCQSGQIMSAAALLRETPLPSDAQIDAAMTNICRCATYGRIRKAIHAAAKSLDA